MEGVEVVEVDVPLMLSARATSLLADVEGDIV